MNKLQLILKGIVKENPTFVLVLGMCPTLGTTTSAANGFGMGVATMAVLILSNIVISLIKNFIPDKVRIPAFIVVIASFVTIVQMLMQAFVPALYATLGVFIPLIVVNCIILGRQRPSPRRTMPSIRRWTVWASAWASRCRSRSSARSANCWAAAPCSAIRSVRPTTCRSYSCWRPADSSCWGI